MCIGVLLECMSLYHFPPDAQGGQKAPRSPGTGVTGGWAPTTCMWDSNLDPTVSSQRS